MDIIHTATAQVVTEEPYRCAKCGYSGMGRAFVVEEASVEQGGLLFGNDRAAEMARDEAQASAWSEAMSNVAMAPCPRCGAIDRSAWIAWITKPRHLLMGAVGMLVFVCGVLLCAAIFSAVNLLSMVCAACMGLGCLVAGPILVMLPIAGSARPRGGFGSSPQADDRHGALGYDPIHALRMKVAIRFPMMFRGWRAALRKSVRGFLGGIDARVAPARS